jgi:hypothetical protein
MGNASRRYSLAHLGADKWRLAYAIEQCPCGAPRQEHVSRKDDEL